MPLPLGEVAKSRYEILTERVRISLSGTAYAVPAPPLGEPLAAVFTAVIIAILRLVQALAQDDRL